MRVHLHSACVVQGGFYRDSFSVDQHDPRYSLVCLKGRYYKCWSWVSSFQKVIVNSTAINTICWSKTKTTVILFTISSIAGVSSMAEAALRPELPPSIFFFSSLVGYLSAITFDCWTHAGWSLLYDSLTTLLAQAKSPHWHSIDRKISNKRCVYFNT